MLDVYYYGTWKVLTNSFAIANFLALATALMVSLIGTLSCSMRVPFTQLLSILIEVSAFLLFYSMPTRSITHNVNVLIAFRLGGEVGNRTPTNK